MIGNISCLINEAYSGVRLAIVGALRLALQECPLPFLARQLISISPEAKSLKCS